MCDGKSYDDYRKDVEMWSFLTSVEAKKKADVLIYLFPDNHPSDIKRKAKNELLPLLVDEDGQKKDDGVDILLEFLDSVFKEDELVETYTK